MHAYKSQSEAPFIHWPFADEADQKRPEIISNLLWPHSKLLSFLFKTDKPELSAPPEVMKDMAGGFSRGEKVLINLALDIWSESGDTKVMELLTLDPYSLQNAVTALFAIA